jgi:hypothetical protein
VALPFFPSERVSRGNGIKCAGGSNTFGDIDCTRIFSVFSDRIFKEEVISKVVSRI